MNNFGVVNLIGWYNCLEFRKFSEEKCRVIFFDWGRNVCLEEREKLEEKGIEV